MCPALMCLLACACSLILCVLSYYVCSHACTLALEWESLLIHRCLVLPGTALFSGNPAETLLPQTLFIYIPL